MSLTQKDMEMLSRMLDEKLDAKLDMKLEPIKSDIVSLKTSVQSLESSVESLDARVQSVESRVTRIEVDLLENNVIPRLNEIESCYTSTYERYRNSADRIEEALEDVDNLKKVAEEHSVILKKIS